MNTDKHGLKYEDLRQKIIGVFYEVYNELGHGFVESVCQNALVLTLRAHGLRVYTRSKYRSGFEEKGRVGSKLTFWLKEESCWS